MTSLSIVIPCYNEAENLPALVEKCAELLTANPEVEIILVNNGSVDDTAHIMAKLLSEKQQPDLKICNVPVNKGYGYGILQGLNDAQGTVLCWTHADLQTDIFDCIKAYHIWLKDQGKLTVIKGKRKGRKIFDVIFTKGMQWYVLFKLGTNVSDINGQPKLFTKAFYDTIKEDAPFDFSLDLYLLIKAKKLGKIIDFPVYFKQRVAGEAKGGSGDLKLKIKLLKRTRAFIKQMANSK